MLPLHGKKILYIGVSTFNYEKEIKAGLERLGADVDYFDERPANDFLTKVFLRLKLKKLIQSKINNYYLSILENIKHIHYDYVFIIKLETIDSVILNKLKHSQQQATFILYLWDSLKNYKGKETLLPYFGRAFSFDSVDTKNYKTLKFLPLFYIPSYKRNSDVKETKYDLCFIGTGHTDRYKIVKKITHLASKNNLSTYSFLFLQNKLIFWFRKIFDKEMRQAQLSDFSFSSLNQKQVFDKIMQSKVIIDIEHKGQVGLTMRTIEMIGSKKKLLTTNPAIKGYDFYNENNILVIDRENLKLDLSFLYSPYQDLDKKTYDKYSLDSWLRHIFSSPL